MSSFPWNYEEGTFTLREICCKHPPPVVIDLCKDGSEETTSSDLSQPLLIYRHRNINKVPAYNVQRELNMEAGPSLLIPEDYKGWFAVLQKKKIHPVTMRNDIMEYKYVADLSNSDTEAFLVGGTEQVNALQVSISCDGKTQHVPKILFPGDILRKGKIFVGESKRKSGFLRRSKMKPEYYLLCTDDNEREILLPFNQKGLFYTLTTQSGKMGCPVLQMKDIIDKRFLPATVKLLFGRLSMSDCNFTGLLRLDHSHFVRTVIGCTVADRNNFVELPISSPLKFKIVEMTKEIIFSEVYKQAYRLCNEKAQLYMRSIKVCGDSDSDGMSLGFEEEEELVPGPSPCILRKKTSLGSNSDDNRESGYIEMRDSVEISDDNLYTDMNNIFSDENTIDLDDIDDSLQLTKSENLHDSLKRHRSFTGCSSSLQPCRSQPPSCLPPPIPSACQGPFNHSNPEMGNSKSIPGDASKRSSARLERAHRDQIYDIPRIPRRLSAPEVLNVHDLRSRVSSSLEVVEEMNKGESIKYENFSILREVVPKSCGRRWSNKHKTLPEPQEYDMLPGICRKVSPNENSQCIETYTDSPSNTSRGESGGARTNVTNPNIAITINESTLHNTNYEGQTTDQEQDKNFTERVFENSKVKRNEESGRLEVKTDSITMDPSTESSSNTLKVVKADSNIIGLIEPEQSIYLPPVKKEHPYTEIIDVEIQSFFSSGEIIQTPPPTACNRTSYFEVTCGLLDENDIQDKNSTLQNEIKTLCEKPEQSNEEDVLGGMSETLQKKDKQCETSQNINEKDMISETSELPNEEDALSESFEAKIENVTLCETHDRLNEEKAPSETSDPLIGEDKPTETAGMLVKDDVLSETYDQQVNKEGLNEKETLRETPYILNEDEVPCKTPISSNKVDALGETSDKPFEDTFCKIFKQLNEKDLLCESSDPPYKNKLCELSTPRNENALCEFQLSEETLCKEPELQNDNHTLFESSEPINGKEPQCEKSLPTNEEYPQCETSLLANEEGMFCETSEPTNKNTICEMSASQIEDTIFDTSKPPNEKNALCETSKSNEEKSQCETSKTLNEEKSQCETSKTLNEEKSQCETSKSNEEKSQCETSKTLNEEKSQCETSKTLNEEKSQCETSKTLNEEKSQCETSNKTLNEENSQSKTLNEENISEQLNLKENGIQCEHHVPVNQKETMSKTSIPLQANLNKEEMRGKTFDSSIASDSILLAEVSTKSKGQEKLFCEHEDDELSRMTSLQIVSAFHKLGIKRTVIDAVDQKSLKGSDLKDLQNLPEMFPGISCIDRRKISMFLQGMMQPVDRSQKYSTSTNKNEKCCTNTNKNDKNCVKTNIDAKNVNSTNRNIVGKNDSPETHNIVNKGEDQVDTSEPIWV